MSFDLNLSLRTTLSKSLSCLIGTTENPEALNLNKVSRWAFYDAKWSFMLLMRDSELDFVV